MRRLVCFGTVILAFAVSLSCGACHKRYEETVLRAREQTLRDDLSSMRRAIKQYTSERGVPPQSLQDLVNAGYFRQIPLDPITEKRDWRLIVGPHESKARIVNGLVDVRSAAVKPSSNGTLYSDW